MNSIITRFAPSPSGNLHIGGIRTALINFILVQQAKKKYPNSKFLLRIEDTDKKRSNSLFEKSIIDGLKWIGINYDEKPYIQSERIKRHQEIAYELLNNKKAFKCICSNEKLQLRRDENRSNKILIKKLCLSCEDNSEVQQIKKGFTLRIKIPVQGEEVIKDIVQGDIKVQNKELDDFILLREDGTPTYMLSVVVDDFDMGVNFIIRGDDHLNNVFRQNYIYKNMNWPIPKYAHIPLIHGIDGKKLSKRHGAVDVNEYKNNGYLKESIINNLILLGWSPNKKNEIIKIDEIIKLFDIKKISKSSSIFSFDKLNYFNNFFINEDPDYLKFLNYCNYESKLIEYLNIDDKKLLKIFEVYKKKLNYYKEIVMICHPYFEYHYDINTNISSYKSINNQLIDFVSIFEGIMDWNVDILENTIKSFIKRTNIKFSSFGRPIRTILINNENGPSISDILYILGKKDSINRIKNYIS